MNRSIETEMQKKRILSVEDDADSRELLEFVLSEYEVVFAESIKDALKAFTEVAFDLCLLDIRLSDGHGTELCSKIRDLNKSVPIVFASGIGTKNDVQQAISSGAQAYLVKPYFPEELLKIVKELI